MSLFNLLLVIIVLSWCDSIKGFSAAVPSARHGNTIIIGGGGGSSDGGMGTAGGGGGGGGGALIPGSVSYQPHDSEEIERAVYDPGDELLRALNAEAAAEAAAVSSRAGGVGGGGVDSSDDYIDNVINDLAMPEKFELLRKLEEDIREEQDIVSKSAMLMKLLEDPTIDTLPVVYIEENPGDDSSNLYPMSSGGGMDKRSRYYRRYPWKRHSRNRGSNYEPEIRYACTPSKEDVFKLLVGLHENRKGNHHKTVNFCNRKRPAKAIFTNIRFLG